MRTYTVLRVLHAFFFLSLFIVKYDIYRKSLSNINIHPRELSQSQHSCSHHSFSLHPHSPSKVASTLTFKVITSLFFLIVHLQIRISKVGFYSAVCQFHTHGISRMCLSVSSFFCSVITFEIHPSFCM